MPEENESPNFLGMPIWLLIVVGAVVALVLIMVAN